MATLTETANQGLANNGLGGGLLLLGLGLRLSAFIHPKGTTHLGGSAQSEMHVLSDTSRGPVRPVRLSLLQAKPTHISFVHSAGEATATHLAHPFRSATE